MRPMYFIVVSCLMCWALAPLTVAQTRDRQGTDSTAEVLQLKLKAAAQEQRIAELEKALQALSDKCVANRDIVDAIQKVEQAVKDIKAVPPPQPIPPTSPAWHAAANWNLVKKGMSRAEVTDILGAPTGESSILDTQTLSYKDETGNGTVTFVGGRVTGMLPPTF